MFRDFLREGGPRIRGILGFSGTVAMVLAEACRRSSGSFPPTLKERKVAREDAHEVLGPSPDALAPLIVASLGVDDAVISITFLRYFLTQTFLEGTPPQLAARLVVVAKIGYFREEQLHTQRSQWTHFRDEELEKGLSVEDAFEELCSQPSALFRNRGGPLEK